MTFRVECVDDECQLDFGGDFIRAGEKYTVLDTYMAHGSLGFVLDGMNRNHPHWGAGWGTLRFRRIVENKAEISFTANAPKDSEKWDNRKRVKVRA